MLLDRRLNRWMEELCDLTFDVTALRHKMKSEDEAAGEVKLMLLQQGGNARST